jgi:hypothetical protein
VTCQGQGVCYDKLSKAECECFMFYEGNDCQIESNELKRIKSVTTVSSVIAIVSIVTIYLTMILSDLHTHFFIKKTIIKTPEIKVHKFRYIN